MRKSILLVLIPLLISGCDNNKAELEEVKLRRAAIVKKIAVSEEAGESVLVVGGEVITSDQIIQTPIEHSEMVASLAEHFKPIAQKSTLEQFKKWARPEIEEILMNKITEILLYQEAKRQAPDNIDEALEKAAEREMRKFILDCGGDQAKAQEKLKQMGMDSKGFKENRKRLILTQLYIASKLSDNRPITYTELMKRYDQMKEQSYVIPAELQFRLIDIQPARLEITDPNQTSASSVEAGRLEQARKLANRLIQQLQAGADFSELAKKYSHGHRRELGGLWQPVQPESLAKPYDILAAAAEKIQQGQIAGPIEVEGHIFIMKLEEKRTKSYEPFEKVQEELEQKIISDRRKEVIDKLKAEIIQQITRGEKDEFIDFCLEKIYQMREDPPAKLGG